MRECDICKKSFQDDELITGHGIRHEIESLIQKDNPKWTDQSRICKTDFYKYRDLYVTGLVDDESGQLKVLHNSVLKSIMDNEIITLSSNEVIQKKMSIGDNIADNVAAFGGSWKFIIIFFSVLFVWILLNSYLLLSKPFDPYPFILMNLILSCIAAIQAPIIMMSQNRQTVKDRIQSENDYKVNLKAEIEVRTLHEKVDHLLLDQWSKMMEIQKMQLEMLEEIRDRKEDPI